MTIGEYFRECKGHYIAIDEEQEKILILDKDQVVVKELYPSASVQDINLTYESIFAEYKNDHNLRSQLHVMINGHNSKDWLYLSHHVLTLWIQKPYTRPSFSFSLHWSLHYC